MVMVSTSSDSCSIVDRSTHHQLLRIPKAFSTTLIFSPHLFRNGKPSALEIGLIRRRVSSTRFLVDMCYCKEEEGWQRSVRTDSYYGGGKPMEKIQEPLLPISHPKEVIAGIYEDQQHYIERKPF